MQNNVSPHNVSVGIGIAKYLWNLLLIFMLWLKRVSGKYDGIERPELSLLLYSHLFSRHKLMDKKKL